MNCKKIKLDEIIIFLIITFLFLLSFEVIDNLILKKIEPYVSEIKSNYLLDIIFFAALILYCISYKTNYPSKRANFTLFLLSLYYTHLRFDSKFQLLSLEVSKPLNYKLYYADAIYIFFLFGILNYLKNISSRELDNDKNILLEDNAIETYDKDLFKDSLKPLVEKLNKIIRENTFKRAFTIGINSEWGTGKTSSLNLLKKELNQSEFITIEYNPWIGFEKKVLIEDFFNVLSENIDNNGLAKDFDEYASKLLDTEKSLLKNIISSIPFIKNEKPSLESLYDLINKKIKLLNKKIVIIIDDIDRLDNKEIFEILKLIRNTANFTNVFFLIAYDRSYVNNSIQNINQFKEKSYLDKIINVELNLPYYHSSLLKSIFNELLVEKIGSEYNDKIGYALNNGFVDIDELFVFRKANDTFTLLITNLREVKKLVNSIVINYQNILKEVNFRDMIYLEILKLKYPSIYKLLYTKKDHIFIENNGGIYLKIKKIDDKEIKLVEEYICEICEKENISEFDKRNAISIVNYLFEYYNGTRSLLDKNYTSDPDEPLSVNYINKFERYFANVIFDNNISETDFNNMIVTNDDEKRKEVILNWIEEGKEDDLKMRFENLKTFVSKQQFENTLKSIFIFAQSNSKKDPHHFIGFDIRKLRDKLEINGQAEDTQLRFYNEKEQYSNFVRILFNLSAPPYRLLRELLVSAINGPYEQNYGLEFPLTKAEMKSKLETLFYEHINENRGLNWDFWGFYHATKYLISNERYRKALCGYITDDMNQKEFILTFIEQIPFEKLVKIRYEFIEQIFGSVEVFEEYLSKMKETEIIKEFKEVYSNIKENNWLGIKYNFNQIPFEYK